MKECVHCNTEFEPSRSDKVYCTDKCGVAFRSKRQRDRNRAKLPPKKCLFCNEDVNRPRKYKYCKDECFRAGMNEKSKAYCKRKVRERHAELPSLHCKRCEIQLKPSLNNYHVLKFCSPCAELYRDEWWQNYYEENKERLNTGNIKRHAIRMQDPEYREMFRLKSIENRAMQPKRFADCLACGNNFQVTRNNKNCSEKCLKIWARTQLNTPTAIMSRNLSRQLYRAITNKGSNWSKGLKLYGNVWTYFNFTIDEFRERFEFLFTKGMKWENMGLWHIDHIKPKASFNQEQLADPTSEDFKKCWELNNLQPLWARDNLKKGAKEMEG